MARSESLDPLKVAAVVAAVALGLFLWDTPWVLPLKLLVVFLHEMGHAVASKLVGGDVKSITVGMNEGGLCYSAYDPTFFKTMVVHSAGYLGSTVAGAGLTYTTLRRDSGRLVLGFVSAALLVASVLWARDLFTLAFGLGMAALLGAFAKFLPDGPARVLAFFIGVFNALYCLFDLRDDLWDSARRSQTDAALLASHTFVPSLVWAGVWSLAAIALLVGAVYFGAHSRVEKAPAPAVPLPSLR